MAERVHLNDTFVARLRERETGEYAVYDGGADGIERLCVRVSAIGGKTFVLRLRVNGRQRWITIGKVGDPWTCEAARTEALRLMVILAQGGDPTAPRSRLKELPTVAKLVERFMNEHAATRMKASSRATTDILFRCHLVPALGDRRIDLVTKGDIKELHDRIGKTHRASANRVVAMAHSLFERAVEWGLLEKNPAKGAARLYKEVPRKRYLSAEEFVRLGEALQEAEATSPYFVAFVRLLCVTGARSGEILNLEWRDVDLDHGVLHLRDSKVGPRDLLLPEAAVTILRNLPRLASNPHVIVGHVRRTHFVGTSKAWAAIRDRAGLSDCRLHDLRHSFASVSVGQGASLPMVGAALGHSQPATTQRYAHLSKSPVHAVVENAGSEIARLLKAK
jgi:integrase